MHPVCTVDLVFNLGWFSPSAPALVQSVVIINLIFFFVLVYCPLKITLSFTLVNLRHRDLIRVPKPHVQKYSTWCAWELIITHRGFFPCCCSVIFLLIPDPSPKWYCSQSLAISTFVSGGLHSSFNVLHFHWNLFEYLFKYNTYQSCILLLTVHMIYIVLIV